MTNRENLISLGERTPEERKKIARSGGLKSGETRRDKVQLKRRLELLLLAKDASGVFEEDNICVALIRQAKEGNIKAFEVIRDTIGQKPISEADIKPTNHHPDLSLLSAEQIKKLAELALKEGV